MILLLTSHIYSVFKGEIGLPGRTGPPGLKGEGFPGPPVNIYHLHSHTDLYTVLYTIEQ